MSSLVQSCIYSKFQWVQAARLMATGEMWAADETVNGTIALSGEHLTDLNQVG